MIRFYGEELLAPRPTPNWRTTPCRLSATAYSIYSQQHSILEAVPASETWGRAMPWWQGPTYHGLMRNEVINKLQSNYYSKNLRNSRKIKEQTLIHSTVVLLLGYRGNILSRKLC